MSTMSGGSWNIRSSVASVVAWPHCTVKSRSATSHGANRPRQNIGDTSPAQYDDCLSLARHSSRAMHASCLSYNLAPAPALARLDAFCSSSEKKPYWNWIPETLSSSKIDSGRERRRREMALSSGARVPSLSATAPAHRANVEAAILEDVPHLSQWMPDLPSHPNPLQDNPAYRAVRQYFVENDDIVAKNVVVKLSSPSDGIYFRRAGPRENVCFEGDEVRACIVTCGGLCPGLNTVIREIVCGLWTSYGVRDIIGIEGGYAGFYSSNTIQLNPKVVNDVHKRGGTILGTSRGGHDKTKIVAAILDRGINQVYIIGGDGTQRGALVIHEELKKLGVKVVVAGIPKTIDNDIAVIDKSFGFDTAVEEAQRAINAAHVEAESVRNGVGLVKLMGRYSGYIAMYATLASRDVDCCLIPEVPFYLDGPGGLYEFVRRRLRENGHMVIVVAEGAGQELIAETSSLKRSDASGNQLLLDVGLWLSQNLRQHFAANKKEALTLKYIDPTYMVRAIPSNASDNVYCTLLAHSAMHGAMAGFTGFTVGPVNGRHAYIPIAMAVETQNKVNITDRMWARLLSSTQQPDFLEYDQAIDEKKKKVMSEKTANSSPVHVSNGDVKGQRSEVTDPIVKDPQQEV